MNNVVMKKFNKCCWGLSIIRRRRIIETGIWCPKSRRVVIDDSIVGFCDTKEEVIKSLKSEKITVEKWHID